MQKKNIETMLWMSVLDKNVFSSWTLKFYTIVRLTLKTGRTLSFL